MWLRRSVVRSWLLELTARDLEANRDLAASMHLSTLREGRWTVQEAIDAEVALPAITGALFTRFRSRDDNPFGDRLLTARRQPFGVTP